MTFLLFLFVLLLLVFGTILGYWIYLTRNYIVAPRADEVHTVTTQDLWKIRLFRYRPKNGGGEPVLLCHGFLANHFNFATPPGEALVDTLTREGYDCWAIDLRGNLSSIPPFGRCHSDASLDDYVLHDIPAAIGYISHVTGYEKVHWVGHSMGGMLMYAYELLIGRNHFASATTLGSPPGFAKTRMKPPLFAIWVRKYSTFLFDLLFRGMTPILVKLKIENDTIFINWENMHPAITPQMYFSSIEVTPRGVAEDMVYIVQTNDWRMKHRQVDVLAGLKTLQTPLLVMYAVADPAINIETGKSFYDSIQNPDKELVILSKETGFSADYNHVDMVFGKNCASEVFPIIVNWLRQHPARPESQNTSELSDAPAKPRPVRKATPRKQTAVITDEVIVAAPEPQPEPQPITEPLVVEPPKAKRKPKTTAALTVAPAPVVAPKQKAAPRKPQSKESTTPSPAAGAAPKAKPSKKAPAKKAPAKKAPAKKAPVKKAPVKKDKES